MPTAFRRRALAAAPMLAISAALLAGCGGSGGSSGAEGAGPPSGAASAVQSQFTDVVSTVSPQVVQIETQEGLGSGIVYDRQGAIVTNAHVAGTAHRFAVTLSGGERHGATLVGTDPGDDIAVIRMSGAQPAPATFDDSSGVRSGQIVFAIGNPLGLQSSVTQGIVSSVDRSVIEANGVTLTGAIQTSAEINPGNSGGALVDLSGHVIGIPTLEALDPDFGDAPAPGVGFAIPSDTVREVADRLIGAGP
jgi:putative serine protease PepD